jgi:hypothetical protein
MERPFSVATAPSKLYAMLLKLRPLERGSIMPFSGELVHAAWLDWIRRTAPDVSAMLHEGNQRRFFTCSSLQFPMPAARLQQMERENTHVMLDPEKTYSVRMTLLLGELFPLFYDTLLRFHRSALGRKEQAFMTIGKQSFLLEEVVTSGDDAGQWTGFTSFAELVDTIKTLRLGRVEPLTLHFDSLTTFHRSSPRGNLYENHYAMLPLPQYVFPGLARRWQELAPPELAEVVQRERIEQYIAEEGLVHSHQRW